MQFLAHRGHWLNPPEKNTRAAFERAWSGRFGIETDVRDRLGMAVIAHDPPDEAAMGLLDFLRMRAVHGAQTPLALNIKADGLAGEVRRLAALSDTRHYFVFDMSVPDTLPYLQAGVPVYVRLSEYEPQSPLLERAAGVWLDAFESDWWGLDLLRGLAGRGNSVAIVSPELHRRPHQTVWQAIGDAEPSVKDRLLLCTDFPDAAERFFAG
jgi:hypothetical protein